MTTARYRTECDECPQPIEPGDDIVSTGERTWAHRWCATALGIPPARRVESRYDGTTLDDMGY